MSNKKSTAYQRHSERIVAGGLFIGFALLYLTFRSISLDDFDSVSFALALKNFDLALQQPQPPGFPVYIMLGRVFSVVFTDPVTALTSLSAISGALAIPLVYWIGRLIDQHHARTALFAAVSYGLLPVTWLTSAKALSDVPGMTAILLAMALWLWVAKTSETAAGKRRILAAFVSGISLGIRPQNALPLALLVLWQLNHALIHRKWHRSWWFATLAGIVGILVWLIPVSLASSDLGAYIGFIQQHAEHVGRADSFFGLVQSGMPWVDALNARFTGFWDTSLLAITGVDPYFPYGPKQRVIIGFISLVAMGGVSLAPWKKRWMQGLGIWLASMVIQSLLTITLDRPRLLLPLMPPLCLIIASGWVNLAQQGHLPQLIGTFAALALVGSLLFTGLPLAQQLATIPSPPVQAINYIQQNLGPQTIIATAGSFRHAQFEAPEYPLIYLYQFDAEAVTTQLANDEIRTIAILDRDQFPADAIDILRHNEEFVTLEDILFTRPRTVHTQHDQVRLQILARSEDIPLSAMHMPVDECIDLGNDADGKYLNAGWFRGETIGGTSARWAGSILTSTLRFAMDKQSGSLNLRLRAMSYNIAQDVTLLLNGKAAGMINIGADWTEVVIALPTELITPDAINILSLVHTEINAPYVITNGSSADQRQLTAAWDWICITSD